MVVKVDDKIVKLNNKRITFRADSCLIFFLVLEKSY